MRIIPYSWMEILFNLQKTNKKKDEQLSCDAEHETIPKK